MLLVECKLDMNVREKQTRLWKDVSLLQLLLSAWSWPKVGTLAEKYEMASMPWICR